MKTIRIIDDTSLNGIASVKLSCDCGWEEKAYAGGAAHARADTHLREKHSGGVKKYQGAFVEVH